jgi:hypothetical protein
MISPEFAVKIAALSVTVFAKAEHATVLCGNERMKTAGRGQVHLRQWRRQRASWSCVKVHMDREICARRVRAENANERQKSTRTSQGATQKRTQMNVTRTLALLTDFLLTRRHRRASAGRGVDDGSLAH